MKVIEILSNEMKIDGLEKGSHKLLVCWGKLEPEKR